MKSSQNPKTAVLKWALFSRILLLSLILLWRTLLSPYDTSGPIDPQCLSQSSAQAHEPEKLLFPSMASAIESSVVWDGVYFVRIAQCGYEYEQTYAFLPVLPVSISFISHTVFAPLAPIIGHRAVLALSGYVINNIAFVFAAVYFYGLSVTILKDGDAALRASILFCFNPASIFYSSIYSESLYALLSIGGLYHLISGKDNIAVLWLALSGCARSNGVINAGYIGFQTMHQAYNAVLRKKTFLAMQGVAGGVVRCICIFVPFLVYQAYGYYAICVRNSGDKLKPWCKARVPLLYSYIQSHYWGVGFLRYFQLKQLPNFLLASPILSLALCSLIHYAKSEPQKFFTLGFHASIEDKNSAAVVIIPEAGLKSSINQRRKRVSSMQENHSSSSKKQMTKGQAPTQHSEKSISSEKIGHLSVWVIPFVLHLGFLALTALFIMHVQVATRFLSSSPPLYWYAAYLMKSRSSQRWGYMIWAYSAAYILLGSLLFSNFYPFT